MDEHKRGERTITSVENTRPSTVIAFPSVRSTHGTRICGRCFARNSSGETFCKVCGEALPGVELDGEGGATRRLSPAVARAKLILHADRAGIQAVMILEKDIALVGRSSPVDKVSPDVDLTAFDFDNFVSRRHAFILRRRGNFVVEDLESINGTYINGGQRLAPHVLTQLNDRDEITFGRTRCTLKIDALSQEP